jgi:hypothetical protein
MGQYHHVGMSVQVNEARADHKSGGVNRPSCLGGIEPANGGYPVTPEADITMVPGAA